MKSPAEIIAEAMYQHECKLADVAPDGALLDQATDVIVAYTEPTNRLIKALAEAGYAVVPRDATDAALSAGLQASLDMMREHGVDGLSPFADYPPPIEVCRRVYRAMLEAAPDAGGGNG